MTTLASLYIWIYVSLEAGWRPPKPRTWLTLLTVALSYIVESMEASMRQKQVELTTPETRSFDSTEFSSFRHHVRAQDKLKRECVRMKVRDDEESLTVLRDALRACIAGVEKERVQVCERREEKQRLIVP
ncbi:hypothetical protein LTR95_002491 [Oleoguttula sp. CCFEE 5521]